jgi:ABC-2 type transport system permease protein
VNVVTRKLIAKELYVNRWFITGGAVAGVVSVLLCTTGKTGFSIGSLSWITTIIAVAVMLSIYSVANERKEHSLQFVLSLPLSIKDYLFAKVVGLVACFLVVWLTGCSAALILIFASPGVPDGLAPYTVLLSVFMLANFAVVMCGAVHARSEALAIASIIVTNMSVSIFMFTVSPLSEIGPHMWESRPFWSETFWTVLCIELVVLAIALSLPFLLAARRRDFI